MCRLRSWMQANYAAVELDERTDAAIQRALDSIFPKVRANGWHKDIDVIIDATTPFLDRIIDQEDFDAKCEAIASGHLKVNAPVK